MNQFTNSREYLLDSMRFALAQSLSTVDDIDQVVRYFSKDVRIYGLSALRC